MSQLRPLAALLVFLLAGWIQVAAAAQDQARRDWRSRGEELYVRACASCHGVDGRGRERSRVGFSNPLPDFTNCDFATREPNADWIAVTHEGGPVRGFDKTMPAFGGALETEEIEAILEHVRRFCADRSWPRGELNLPRPFVTEKAFPEDEAVFSTSATVEGEGVVDNELVYERRLGARNQLEIVVPFGFLEQPAASGGGWTGGRLGDVAIGLKRALFHDIERGSILSVSGEVKLPTGDEQGGFGTGTSAFEPFVAFGQLFPMGMFLHLQAGVELPFDTDHAEREAFWRIVPGKSFTFRRFGRAWSPMVEVLGQRGLEEGAEVEWDLLPQVQLTLNQRQHIMVNVGVRVPITQTNERDTAVLVYLLWDFFDGGFLEGW